MDLAEQSSQEGGTPLPPRPAGSLQRTYSQRAIGRGLPSVRTNMRTPTSMSSQRTLRSDYGTYGADSNEFRDENKCHDSLPQTPTRAMAKMSSLTLNSPISFSSNGRPPIPTPTSLEPSPLLEFAPIARPPLPARTAGSLERHVSDGAIPLYTSPMSPMLRNGWERTSSFDGTLSMASARTLFQPARMQESVAESNSSPLEPTFSRFRSNSVDYSAPDSDPGEVIKRQRTVVRSLSNRTFSLCDVSLPGGDEDEDEDDPPSPSSQSSQSTLPLSSCPSSQSLSQDGFGSSIHNIEPRDHIYHISESESNYKGQLIKPEHLSLLIEATSPYMPKYDKIIIVDCRYPYEYEGGHIRGAINVYNPHQLPRAFFFQVNKEKALRTLIVMHCEFSSQRAPDMLKQMRQWDREMNKSNYPNLYYPELYLLKGGYKAFFEEFPHLCEPNAYIIRDDERFAAQRRHHRNEVREATRGGGLRRTNSLHVAPQPRFL